MRSGHLSSPHTLEGLELQSEPTSTAWTLTSFPDTRATVPTADEGTDMATLGPTMAGPAPVFPQQLYRMDEGSVSCSPSLANSWAFIFKDKEITQLLFSPLLTSETAEWCVWDSSPRTPALHFTGRKRRQGAYHCRPGSPLLLEGPSNS